MTDNELRQRRGGRRAGSGRKKIYPPEARAIQLVVSPTVLRRLKSNRGAASVRAHASAILTAAVLGSAPESGE